MSSRSRALYADSETPHGTPSSAPYLHLPAHDEAAGLLEQAPRRRAHHQRRHQVLEHRSRPRDQRRAAVDRRQGAPEAKPVPRRHVAFGDRDEARQARLGGEQVVAVGIERAVGDLVADREELPRRVEAESRTPWRRTSSRASSASAARRRSSARAALAERSSGVDQRVGCAASASSPASVCAATLRPLTAQDDDAPPRSGPADRPGSGPSRSKSRSARPRVDGVDRSCAGDALRRADETRPGHQLLAGRAGGSWIEARTASAQVSTSAPAPSPRSSVSVRAMSATVSACDRELRQPSGNARRRRGSRAGARPRARRAPRPAACASPSACAGRRRARAGTRG